MLLPAYFLMDQTLPLASECNERSERLLKGWRNNLLQVKTDRVYWIKMLNSERSVALYYAMTKFEKETRTNYHFQIIDCTVNVLLVT